MSEGNIAERDRLSRLTKQANNSVEYVDQADGLEIGLQFPDKDPDLDPTPDNTIMGVARPWPPHTLRVVMPYDHPLYAQVVAYYSEQALAAQSGSTDLVRRSGT